MRLLAIDPGRNVGWAGPNRSSGVEPFLDADHGKALWQFNEWFARLLDKVAPDKLVVERGFGGNRANGRITTAIELQAHAIAASRKVDRTDRAAAQVRKWLLGYSSISAKEIPVAARREREMDRRILAAVHGLGFKPPNEHGADACALLAYVEMGGMPLR